MSKYCVAVLTVSICLAGGTVFAQPTIADRPTVDRVMFDELEVASVTISPCHADIDCLAMDDALAGLRIVTLESQVTGTPLEYRAWEGTSLTNVRWRPYAPTVRFDVSRGVGLKYVHFQVRKKRDMRSLDAGATIPAPRRDADLRRRPADSRRLLDSVVGQDPSYAYSEIATVAYPVTRRITIASIGDSLASGEGAPNITGGGPGIWTDPQCHRSTQNARALAVADLRDRFVDGAHVEAIDYLDLGCTGATINVGLLGPFAGTTVDTDGDGVREVLQAKPAQLAEVGAWLGDRRLDVLVVSIGVNDVSFSRIVASCISPLSPGCQRDAHLADVVFNGDIQSTTARVGLANLPAAYDALDDAIEQLNPRHVLITEYPDPTHDGAESFCGCAHEVGTLVQRGLVGPASVINVDRCMDDAFTVLPGHVWWGELEPAPIGGSARLLSSAETRWVFNGVLRPLNDTARAAALRNGWTYVGGNMSATRAHGVCVQDQQDRFFNTLSDAFYGQGDLNGSLHPNLAGHRALRDVLLPELVSTLDLEPAP